jgi:hypothetical protein
MASRLVVSLPFTSEQTISKTVCNIVHWQMAEYRAYIIGADGSFVRAIELVCPDDDSARECARQLVDGYDVELWQGDRHVAKYDHKPK